MGPPLCILLVDDSKFFLELEKQFLRNTPASILLAASADEALAAARQHRPSLVYMDMDMPVVDGLECCRAFKADALLRGIPVVLIGNRATPADEQNARVAGADAYLAKPLDRRHFLGVGHRFLVSIDRREARRICCLPVEFSYRGRQLQGHCIDLSSGGMFLDCPPAACKGERLGLRFCLPDEHRTPVELHGRIAWVNASGAIIKPDYPLGYGVEFVNISAVAGTALRRCFGS